MHASLASVTATPFDHFNSPEDIGRELDINFYFLKIKSKCGISFVGNNGLYYLFEQLDSLHRYIIKRITIEKII